MGDPRETQAPPASATTTKPTKNAPSTSKDLLLELRKYILLLASLVATVTYSAGFNPPGGVWQDTVNTAAAHHLAGDPIIRNTHYARYLVFFYFNATAFASSLVVIVLVLILASADDKKAHHTKIPCITTRGSTTRPEKNPWATVWPLQVVMVLDLLSLMGAYAAGTCRDMFTTVYSSVLVSAVFIYLVVQVLLASMTKTPGSDGGAAHSRAVEERRTTICSLVMSWLQGSPYSDDALRKVLMLLATFAVSVTYAAGLSTPGGFWDSTGPGYLPGDEILRHRHGPRLAVFFAFNTAAFVASLLIIVVLLDKELRKINAYGFIIVALISLLGAYTAGSCRQIDTTVYVASLVAAVLVYIYILQLTKLALLIERIRDSVSEWWKNRKLPKERKANSVVTTATVAADAPEIKANNNGSVVPTATVAADAPEIKANNNGSVVPTATVASDAPDNGNNNGSVVPPPTGAAEAGEEAVVDAKAREKSASEKARSLVLLLATLAATITYQAGLDPPGGTWQDNSNGHKAGDPVLLTVSPRRFQAFFYCNSVSFVASLVAVVLVQINDNPLLKHHALEAAMILDLFGLIGAYAAGSCRDISNSVYAMALAGAVLVYVVIHVVFVTLDHKDSGGEELNKLLEKRRKRVLLFAILAATITYQAGLTPPGGFRFQADDSGHHAGDPVLLYNFPRRYRAFFYCNSVSFMLSIALIILLVNPHLYRPAIRSHALSVCTAAGLFGLMGAYAAGSTQYFKTSIYIFVLVGVVLFFVGLLFLVFLCKGIGCPQDESSGSQQAAAGAGQTTISNTEEEEKRKKTHAKRKYLMLLGILVASVTYQAGLEPPGGAWQNNSDGNEAGDPVMHDNRRPRYLAFFYSNSTSFVASIVVILLLLVPEKLLVVQKEKSSVVPEKPSTQEDETERSSVVPEEPSQEDETEKPPVAPEKPLVPTQEDERLKRWLVVMNTTIVLDLLGLLLSYAAGSSRGWRTSVYVVVLIIAVLLYMAIHVTLSHISKRKQPRTVSGQAQP